MEFQDQYKHPKWQKRRLERLEAESWVCNSCGVADKQLHVHHKQYHKGRMIWDYSDDELSVLCNSCHKETHDLLNSIKAMLSVVDTSILHEVSAYVRCLCLLDDHIQLDTPFAVSGVAAACGITKQEVMALSENGSFPVKEFFDNRIKKAKELLNRG